MIYLPIGFTATKYPGYFWHIQEQRLYSIKVSGVLKPMKKVSPNPFNKILEPGYRVSVSGRRRFLPMSYLQNLVVEDKEVMRSE